MSDMLKEMRQDTGLSVRQVATMLGFDTHSRYSYYESPRFKGALPIEMARRLVQLFEPFGVEPPKVLELAGLNPREAESEGALALADKLQRDRRQLVHLTVMLPSEASLTEMFDGMLSAAGRPDLSDELARTLAQLLPSALSATPVGAAEEYRHSRHESPAAKPRSRAKATPGSPQ